MSALRGELTDLVPGVLALERRTEGERLVLTPIGELDVATAERLHETLIGMENASPERLLLDLGRLSFIDSAGLRLIITWHRRCLSQGRPLLELRPGSRAIQRVFQITGIENGLPFVS
jgi:anti-anti-sigma factor